MALTQHTGQLNDRLHALHLPLNDDVEVLFLDLREEQEVNGSRVAGLGVLGDEFPKTLVDALGQERRVGGLQIERQHYEISWQTNMIHVPLSGTT